VEFVEVSKIVLSKFEETIMEKSMKAHVMQGLRRMDEGTGLR